MSLEYGPENLVPLFSNEAEMSTLGSMILSERAADEVIGILTVPDFYRPSHRLVFGAMVALREKRLQIDLVTLRDELKARGNLADIGGEDYLIQVAEFVPSPGNSATYAGIVRDKSVLRQLESHAKEIHGVVHGEGTADEKLAEVENAFRRIGAGQPLTFTKSAYELAKRFMSKVDAFMEDGKAPGGIKTGFHKLDWRTTGHYPGDLIIIGARPAMGKTAFVTDIAVNIARDLYRAQEGGAVAVFSLEMAADALFEGMAAIISGVSTLKIRRGTPLSDHEYELFAEACEFLHRLPIFIIDGGSLTPTQMLTKARQIKREHGLTAVMVDYLQLMTTGRKTAGRIEAIDEIARGLKVNAKDLEVPIFALSQLSRAVEGREDKRPQLSDIRESGSIEANADLVMLLYREGYYKAKKQSTEEADIETAEVIIAKQRNGETGVVELGFQPKLTRFRNT